MVISKSVKINAPAPLIWEALTNPDLVKEYFFGTKVQSDWKEGSSITYTGEWEGKEYVDKGTLLKVEPNKYIKQTYWSSMSGTEDALENYVNITYEIEENGDHAVFTVTQDGFTDKDKMNHSEQSWESILNNLKALVEKNYKEKEKVNI